MNLTPLSASAVYNQTPAALPTTTKNASSGPEEEFPFLTADDISTLERLSGKDSVAALQSGRDRETLHWVNDARARGDVTGNLAQYMPGANLTASDAALLEAMTSTTNINDATINDDARILMMQISSDRTSGSLVGSVSTTYLENILGASAQLEHIGSYGHLASTDFLEKAVANIQEARNRVSHLDLNIVG